jgi:hypothetical protein
MYILGFVQGQPAEQWIRHLMGQQNGRKDYLALKNHYGGIGNVSRRLVDANSSYANLYYSNEKSMSYDSFINKAQKMWTIFQSHDQEYNNAAKVHWLFRQIRSSDDNVKSQIASLKTRNRETNGSLLYADVADAIASAISECSTSKFTRSAAGVSQRVSFAANKGSASDQKSTNLAPKEVGKFTKEEWDSFSFKKRQQIRNKRDKLGLPGGNRKDTKSDEKANKADSWKNKASKAKALSKSEERIASAIGSVLVKAVASNASVAASDLSETAVSNNAGSAFGGQNDVQRKKNS